MCERREGAFAQVVSLNNIIGSWASDASLSQCLYIAVMEELNPTPKENQPQTEVAPEVEAQTPQEKPEVPVQQDSEPVANEPAAPQEEATPERISDKDKVEEHPDETPEENTEEPIVRYSDQELMAMSTGEIVDALATLLEQPTLPSKRSVDTLRRIFNSKLRRSSSSNEEAATEETEALQIQESRLNDLYRAFVERFREQMAKQHEEAVANLAVKKQLAARLKALIESSEDFGVITKNFREIQQEWRNTGKVPEADYNDLQREWSLLVEQFYDLRQLNDEFRAYDFKKNLASKEELIERAKALTESQDPPAALREINELHFLWKEIGPVEKEKRDEIWKAFSEYSKIVRQRADDVFLSRKAEQEQNLEQKRKICEAIEEVPYGDLKTYREWREYSDKIIDLQRKWKEIGAVPQAEAKPLYLRLRAASDLFFSKRTIFYKELHEEQNDIYEQKLALVEEAESLANSTNWNETADRLKAIQQEWKEGGYITNGRKNKELWERLRAACDTFFSAYNERRKQRRRAYQEQVGNLKRKQQLTKDTEKLLANEEGLAREEVEERLGKIVEEFRSVGHVPIKEKDAAHKAFYDKVNDTLRKFNIVLRTNQGRNHNQTTDNNARSGEDNNTPIAEINDVKQAKQRMEALIRERDRIRTQIMTASGNAGLITSSSEWGNKMMQGVEKNIDVLKQRQESIMQSIAECRAKIKELRDEKEKPTQSEEGQENVTEE